MKRWLLGAALALAACTSREQASSMATTGPSVYAVTATLHDEHAVPMGLDVYRGHPVIVSMFYGSCPVACPLIISHVQEVEARLSPAARADFRVLLVSFDAERDTPEALAAIARAHHVDLARWTFATGSDDDVRQVAAVLGVSYRKLPNGTFAHDSVITLLARDGRPVARDDDPVADVAPLAAAAEAMR